MVANNRQVQRPRNNSGTIGRACSVLSLAGGAAALAPGWGTGLGCGAAVCCDSFLAACASDGPPDVGFAATPTWLCGAAFVAGVAADPAVAESALPSCAVELVAATCT